MYQGPRHIALQIAPPIKHRLGLFPIGKLIEKSCCYLQTPGVMDAGKISSDRHGPDPKKSTINAGGECARAFRV